MNIEGNGAPSKSTVGAIGDQYTDSLTGTVYECAYIVRTEKYNSSDVEYIWKKVIEEDKDSGGSGSSINIQTAKVGQTIVVKSVDAAGKPTAWYSKSIEKAISSGGATISMSFDVSAWDDDFAEAGISAGVHVAITKVTLYA